MISQKEVFENDSLEKQLFIFKHIHIAHICLCLSVKNELKTKFALIWTKKRILTLTKEQKTNTHAGAGRTLKGKAVSAPVGVYKLLFYQRKSYERYQI